MKAYILLHFKDKAVQCLAAYTDHPELMHLVNTRQLRNLTVVQLQNIQEGGEHRVSNYERYELVECIPVQTEEQDQIPLKVAPNQTGETW